MFFIDSVVYKYVFLTYFKLLSNVFDMINLLNFSWDVMKIHIDIDCFFVSAHRTKDKSLVGVPVGVGGKGDGSIFTKTSSAKFIDSGSLISIFYQQFHKRDDDLSYFMDQYGDVRGILTTSSYEARACGVKTAMSIKEALILCPSLRVIAPDMGLYHDLSNRLHRFLELKIPILEKASIDEFYGDITGWIDDEDMEDFINSLRKDIQKEFDLPVSIGAANTRYIAKLATTLAKPFGCKVVTVAEFDNFINPLHVRLFPGIGNSMMQKLNTLKIYTLGDLRQRKGTVCSWGHYAKEIYKRVNAESDAPINSNTKRKSIGISRTFSAIFDRHELRRRVAVLSRHLIFAVQKLEVIPTTFTFGIKYELNKSSHVSKTKLKEFDEREFRDFCMQMFELADSYKRLHVIRLFITCKEFTHISRRELSLLEVSDTALTKKIHAIREKHGLDILKWGGELD